MSMKSGGFTAVLLLLLLLTGTSAAAQEPWSLDAQRAEGYYRAGDYNAAWLFYERALQNGCDDGIQVFRAAESFRYQDMAEDAEFSAQLYAAAHYFLTAQYPESPAVNAALNFIPPHIEMNRRLIRRVYTRLGGRVPRLRNPAASGIALVRDFLTEHFTELRGLYSAARGDGIPAAFSLARSRFPRILLSLLIFSVPTGLLLPLVMARAVSLEGRKSYVTAYAFLLHWGILGVHRFYLGRVISGFIWLLTGGLLGAGIFFDIFLTGAYVRFWNEDNKNERPVFRGRSSGQSSGRFPKARRKRPSSKAGNTPRSARKSKAGKRSPARRTSAPRKAAPKKAAPEEEFSFAAPAAGAAAAAGGAAAASSADSAPADPSASSAPSADNEDFSDNFDDLGSLDDLNFSEPAESGADAAAADASGADSAAEMSLELEDDDFNIEMPE